MFQGSRECICGRIRPYLGNPILHKYLQNASRYILSGMRSKILHGVLSHILSGILSGMCSDILSGILSRNFEFVLKYVCETFGNCCRKCLGNFGDFVGKKNFIYFFWVGNCLGNTWETFGNCWEISGKLLGLKGSLIFLGKLLEHF